MNESCKATSNISASQLYGLMSMNFKETSVMQMIYLFNKAIKQSYFILSSNNAFCNIGPIAGKTPLYILSSKQVGRQIYLNIFHFVIS